MTYYALKSSIGLYVKAVRPSGSLGLTPSLSMDIVSDRRDFLDSLADLWNIGKAAPIEVVEVSLEEVEK